MTEIKNICCENCKYYKQTKKEHYCKLATAEAYKNNNLCKIGNNTHTGKIILYEPKYTGYGYHGGGRPRKDTEARRVTISISGTPSEIAALKEKAAATGLNVSRFVLDNLTK